MRISDWSSDVCSSDLRVDRGKANLLGVEAWPGVKDTLDRATGHDGRGNIVDGNASATNDRSTAENIVGGPDDFARCSQIVQPLARSLHEGQQIDGQELVADDPVLAQQRSEERSVGKEGVRTCKSRRTQYNEKKTQ